MSHRDLSAAWMYAMRSPDGGTEHDTQVKIGTNNGGPQKPISFWPMAGPCVTLLAEMSFAKSMFDSRRVRRYCPRIRY